ncbi:hypothetical protein LUZ60_011955 [Juncus effusus]|nr:hypothetical protein LUZ60_011955 [Juncus effusus]
MRRIFAGAGAGEEEEERALLAGPARRSLRRWARPAPYSPSPRCSFLPSRLSQTTSLRGNEQRVELRSEGEQIANDETEIAEIEHHLKNRTFTREEVDRLTEILRSRTPALQNSGTFPTKAPHFLNNSESTLTRSLLKNTSWKPGDSVYSKASATESTPIEIAKAYMKSIGSSTPNKTDYSPNIRSNILKNQFENSGTKSNINWPGAVLQDKNVLRSPNSSEGNKSMAFSNTPSRSPYPDSHFSRSSFKVKNDRDSYDIFSTGKKRRFSPFEGSNSMKPNLIFHEESESTPKPSFEKKEYSLNESIPINMRKSSEKADKILKFLERPVSTPSPFKKSFLQETKIQEKESHKETKNRELESRSISFGNQKPEIRDSKSLQITKDSGLKSASKPPLNPPQKSQNSTNPTTGGSSFSFPVPNNKFNEPPPTPTMPSSPSLTIPVVPAVPTFQFGNPNSNSSRLVFSFGNSNSNEVSPFGGESVPVFKFGSEQKRDLDFGLGTKDAVCC